MGHTNAVIVGERSPAAEILRAILADERITTRVIDPPKVCSDLAAVAEEAGIVLVSATLPDGAVQAVQNIVTLRAGRRVPVVVYAEADAAELDRHVCAGADYLLPPFRAEVLRCRMAGYSADSTEAVANATHLAQYEKELEIGREIQAGFLPETLPSPPGWQIEVRFRPARQVAGDFYDSFDLVNGRRVGFVVADVCDKGVGAALFMALIRSLLRNMAGHGGALSLVGLNVEWDTTGDSVRGSQPSPTSAGIGPLLNAVIWTDHYLVQNHLRQGYFATLFFGLLDPATGSVVYVNCGHNPPVLRRRNGEQVTLMPTGPALGMMPGSSFRVGWAQLELGDLLFLYTDGVTEAKDAHGEFYTEQRMRSVLARSGELDARGLLAQFDAELDAHIGESEPFDDITMMALCRSEQPAVAVAQHVADEQS